MTHNPMTKRILVIGEAGCSDVIRQYVGTADVTISGTIAKALDLYTQSNFDKIIADPEYIIKLERGLLALLSAAINSKLDDVITHLDLQLNFIWANPAFEMLIGPTLGNIKGKNYCELNPSDDDQSIFSFVKNEKSPLRISVPIIDSKSEIICTVAGLRSQTELISGYVISITHEKRDVSKVFRSAKYTKQPQPVDHERKRLQATIEQLKQEVEQRRRDINDLVAFEDKRREVYEREHRIAEILQQALIPPQLSYDIDNCRIVVKYQPALDEAAVGGDFYDIFQLDDEKIGIVIGDIAGKGLPAAMRVAAARYSIRSYAFLDPSPSVVMTLANQALCREQTEDAGLLTAFYAVLDQKTSILTFANGGHEPPLIITAAGDVVEINLQGGGLGFYEGFIYAENELEMKNGEIVVMITDGITEARSAQGRLFDKQGVKRYLEEHSRLDLESLAQGLVDAARDHASGNLQDDAAVVVMQLQK
jgi:serine phosphatase RsbU (regulator of sigma subunit)